ncbi:YunG family protein [Aquabacterium humicola]|uniref:YunG family protein n=1 Tax=Aquabacterium humicola TaxID=3237377 RepID=UPI003F74FC9F
MPLSLQQLEQIIRAEWCAETAWSPPAWNRSAPAAGQCYSTAFVIKSLLGGEIVHAEVLPNTQPKQRHAWNRLDSGTEIDLTSEQFPIGQQFLPCELPEELVWSVAGKQASLLLERVLARLPTARVRTEA